MLTNLKNVFKVADLRNKVLFTLAMIVLYRVGCYMPAPGVDFTQLKALQQQAQSGGVLSFLGLFSGGALTRIAVFALGIMPYITSSIIIQILGVVIPKLEEWQDQGAVGQRKITQWTRYVTIGIAVVQSVGLAYLFHNGGLGVNVDLVPKFDLWHVFLIVLTLTAGTALLMWMGELVTQRGVGNGMSLLIFASVVSVLPSQLGQIYANGGVTATVMVLIGFAAILVAIVYVEQGQRRIPVQFAKRVVGRRMYGGQSTYIPIKVNQSGVIPIIFASSVLYLPQLLSFLIPSTGWGATVQGWVNSDLSKPNSPVHMLVFGLLIIGFAYFYTAITFDPVKQADTLRKQGGFIPGIRPGPQTERYLAKVLSRITLPGALFIAVVALIPSFVLTTYLPGTTVQFTGISILISVGVALETMKQVDSQLMMRNYEGFLEVVVRLVFFGRQGAGKGTQAARLSEHYGAPHISTGDMLRAAVANESPVGLRAKGFMDAGQLVPDDVMLGVVEERLAQPDAAAHGFLLDGYPRTVVQAEALLGSVEVDLAVDIDVPEPVVLERISSRRVCSSCGRIYSTAEPPSSDWTCDTCGGEVVQRADDTPEAVARRLAAYASETQPTIDVFESRGLLVRVDGLGTPDEVTERLLGALDARLAR